MESKRQHQLDTILQHSQLDVLDTISSLINVIEENVKAGFKNEQFDVYNNHLTILKDFVSYSSIQNEAAGTDQCVATEKNVDKDNNKVKAETFHRVCRPLLDNLFPSQNSDPDILVLLGNTAKLTAACVVKNEALLIEVVEFITSNVDTFVREGPSSYDLLHDKSTPDISTQLEVLRHILGVTSSFGGFETSVLSQLSILFEKLTKTVKNISNEIIGTSCIPVLLKILNISKDYDQLMDVVWECVKQCREDAERKEYLLLCGFANHFFPVNGQLRNNDTIDVRKDGQFWSMLQTGLYSKDSLTRKRSLYLIKRIVDICESNLVELNGDVEAVFWWTKEKRSTLSKVWEDFMLLAEVFEEKQVHVIRPLLPRMKNLVKACCLNADKERPLLHTSWLKTVLLRCSHHESLQIIRWSAETVLSLDLTECPMIEQGLDEYLAGEMLYSLQEPKLYVKETSAPAGTLPVIADKLVQYFSTCWSSLPADRRGTFFSLTLRNIAAKDWGPIPLLFICRGIAMVPQSPCLDGATVLCLRKLLTGFLFTMDTFFRGAIQGYIVQILVKLTDKSKVSLEDFMQILSLVRQDECLQRGTTLWSQCVTWFSEESVDQSGWSSDGIRQYLETTVSTYLQTTIDSKYSVGDRTAAGNVARLLLLASDASIATKKDDSGSNTLTRITDSVVAVLNSINTHAYMSAHKADKALLLLSLLVTEAGPKDCVPDDDVKKVIYSGVENCQSEMAAYICRQMFEVIVSLEDLGVLHLYMETVEMITKCMGVKCCPYLKPLVGRCVNVLTQPTENLGMKEKVHQLASMCILGQMSCFLVGEHDKNYTDLRNQVCSLSKSWKVVSNFSKPVGVQSLSHQEWGRVTSLFLEQEWLVILLAVQHESTHWYDMQELLTVAEDTLSVGMEETAVIVLRCLKLIIPQVKDVVSEDRMVTVLTTCWSCLQEARRLLAFWDVLESFVQATFQSCLLQMDKDSPVVKKLIEFADEMIEMGTDKNGVVNALSTQLYKILSKPDMIGHTGKYTSVIVNLCRFGSLVRRGVRQVYDICAALEQDGKACPANGLIKGIQNEDIKVRVAVVSLLCSLNPSDPSHCCIATSIIQSCYQVYCDVAKTTFNRFANSLVHRQRHRLMQIVLLLQHFVTDDYVNDLWDVVWSSLEFETQPSIRHMLEWLILWMMYKHEHFRPQLWLLFEKYRDTKNLTVCSLLCIVIHLGPHLPKHEQEEYFKKAIPYILPWCMAHHFQTRIYSQAVLAKLWDQCRLLGLNEILKENAILQCIMDFTQENRNSTKNVKKLLDSFVFKYLDFERDFTLETLFQIMPKMTALIEEDWISPDSFIDLNPAWSDNSSSSFLRLHNTSREFEECDLGLWKYTGLKVPEEDEAAGDTGVEDGEGDVQKKIMPWRQMMLEEDAVSDVDHGVKQLAEEGLVVVTSLINKVPNLGGLCRTSEIFGVSEYVMGKLGYTEDKAFQYLSVTAQKWIPITEVHESKLEDYLQQKRLEGYTLVGVEQTANSVSLTDYIFPEKTLLLLGNEKEGIPVELISHLDVCVEIPQQGVVRSLNVHVSGAILIWEYRRQQLMKAL